MPEPTSPPQSGKPGASTAQERGSSGTISADQVQAMIDQALARQATEHQAVIRQVAGGAPLPPHSAGPGTEVADTWSLAQQQASMLAEEAGDRPGKPPAEE